MMLNSGCFRLPTICCTCLIPYLLSRGEESWGAGVELPNQIVWGLVCMGNSILISIWCGCTPAIFCVITRHRNVVSLSDTIPSQLDSAVQVARPVFGEFVTCFDAWYKMINVIFADAFNPKIVHHQRKQNRPLIVVPQQAWSVLGVFEVTKWGKFSRFRCQLIFELFHLHQQWCRCQCRRPRRTDAITTTTGTSRTRIENIPSPAIHGRLLDLRCPRPIS